MRHVSYPYFVEDGWSGTTPELEYPGLQIIVLGEAYARSYYPAAHNEVCISISTTQDWGYGTGTIPLNARFSDILRLRFDDMALDHQQDGINMSDVQSDEIAKFVIKHRDKPRLIIHCFAGMSRSRSTAEAIARAFDLPYKFTVRNEIVFEKVYNSLLKELEGGTCTLE